MRQPLCEGCSYYEKVVAKEVGTVVHSCQNFRGLLQRLTSQVTECNSYFQKNQPNVFLEDAWIIRTDKKTGRVRFDRPTKHKW